MRQRRTSAATTFPLTTEAYSHPDSLVRRRSFRPHFFSGSSLCRSARPGARSDPATPENGGLEVAPELHTSGLLPEADDGTLDRAFCDTLTWKPIPMEPGDVLLFDSYVPHRSGPNRLYLLG
jgi:hypothetical protein